MNTKNINLSLLLFVAVSIAAMESDEINKKIENLKTINQKHELKCIEYFNKKITNQDQEIRIIKNKLSNIQKQISDTQKSAFANIQTTYNIPDDQWTWIQNAFSIEKISLLKNSNQKLPIIAEDKEFPLLETLQKHLEDNNISKTIVNITYTNNGFYVNSPHVFSFVENNYLKMEIVDHALININKYIFNHLSSQAQEGLCIRLINQLENDAHYAILDSILNTFKINNNIPGLKKIIRDLSLLKLALQNKQIAHLLKSFFIEAYDETISENQYKMLFKIDQLHRILAYLKSSKGI